MNNLLLEIQNGIALLATNWPKFLSVLNNETLSELGTCLSEIEKREDAKVVTLTDSDGKFSVVDADISETVNATPTEGSAMGQLARKVSGHLEGILQVATVAVGGYALSGDYEISIACDIHVASENTKFARPGCGLGILPGFGGTQRLSRLVGKGRAKELIFTCDVIDTQGVYHIGLVNKVVPLAELIDYCRVMAGRIMKNAPIGVALTGEAINTDSDTDLNNGLRLEASLFGLSFSTQDKKEGMTTFLEKRKEKHSIGE